MKVSRCETVGCPGEGEFASEEFDGLYEMISRRRCKECFLKAQEYERKRRANMIAHSERTHEIWQKIQDIGKAGLTDEERAFYESKRSNNGLPVT